MKIFRGRIWWGGVTLSACTAGVIVVAVVQAQPPRGERDVASLVDSSVKRLMAYDANGDGKLSKTEVTDSRLQPLLQRADADKDGVVTKEELVALLTKEAATMPRGGPGGGPGGPPRGPGGPPRPR